MGWKPIETAPTDGTRILIYCGWGEHWAIEIAEWREEYPYERLPGHWLINQHNDYEFREYALNPADRQHGLDAVATHWQPLPEVPEPSS